MVREKIELFMRQKGNKVIVAQIIVILSFFSLNGIHNKNTLVKEIKGMVNKIKKLEEEKSTLESFRIKILENMHMNGHLFPLPEAEGMSESTIKIVTIGEEDLPIIGTQKLSTSIIENKKNIKTFHINLKKLSPDFTEILELNSGNEGEDYSSSFPLSFHSFREKSAIIVLGKDSTILGSVVMNGRESASERALIKEYLLKFIDENLGN